MKYLHRSLVRCSMELNRILTDKDRENLLPTIELMYRLCPEMMSRKIPTANVQQAFVLDLVLSLDKVGDRILSVGCFEDTAYSSLVTLKKEIIGIDPEINYSLDTYFKTNPDKFNIIFSTSTIEHVKDDELFLSEICQLLKPDGFGILTTDFKDEYKHGDPLPATDLRFYTKNDLYNRLPNILSRYDCRLVGSPNWEDVDNFIYQGHNYSFATFVFRKDLNV